MWYGSTLPQVLLLLSLFEFAKTKRTELSRDKGGNDDCHNHYVWNQKPRGKMRQTRKTVCTTLVHRGEYETKGAALL